MRMGVSLNCIDDDEWSWEVERVADDKQFGSNSEMVAGGVELTKGAAVAKIKAALDGIGCALTDAIMLPL